MRKIILAIGSSELGGAQKVFLLMIRELQKKGLEILVFLPEGPLVSSVREINCPLVIIDYRSLKFWRKLLSVLKQNDIGIINTYLTGCSLYFSLINLLYGHPLCASLHNQIIHEKLAGLQKKVYPFLYRMLSKMVGGIIVNSKYNKKHFELVAGIDAKKIKVIPNGIDDSFGKKVGGIEIEKKVQTRISYFGRLSKEKGVINLIKALAFLEHFDLDCLIVGDGPLRIELESYVYENGLSSRIHFLGFKTAIEPYLSSSDIVVVPSLNEAFGIAIIEAFAYRKLVIGSNVGAIPELIQDGITGLLFEVNDYKGLSEKIAYAVQNMAEAIQIGENAYLFFEGAYTSKAMCDNSLAFFEEIIASK